MFSPAQYEDKKFLSEMAELILLLAKVGTPEAIDLAEKFGEHYLALEEKIKTHDYSREDKFYEPLCQS